MTRVILDEAIKSKLLNLTQPLELCDESGRVLGNFAPSINLAEYESCEPEISEEELRQREQSTEWYSTQEVIERLKEH